MPISNQQIKHALDTVYVKNFRYLPEHTLSGKTDSTVISDWDTFKLEEKVSIAAKLIGPSLYPESHKVITLAYMSLCQFKKLPEDCQKQYNVVSFMQKMRVVK